MFVDKLEMVGVLVEEIDIGFKVKCILDWFKVVDVVIELYFGFLMDL